MSKKKVHLKKILSSLTCLISVLGLGFVNVQATERSQPVKMGMTPYESGTVYYDLDHIYTLSGTRHGEAWSDRTASMAVLKENGDREMVFCIQPGVPLSGGPTTEDYESIPTDQVSERAQLASSLWTRVFPNKTQHEEMVARALVWESLPEYGIKVTSISGIPDFSTLKAKLSKAIDDYLKKPSFDGKTTLLNYGKTTKLDSGGVDLHLYDTVTNNDANVTFDVAADGLSASVTPKDKTKVNGTYAAKSSFAEGTPIAWTKEGSQTVMISRIKHTANFLTKFLIQLSGTVNVKKVDDNGKILRGAEFTLTDQKGNQTKKVTDDKGLASFTIQSGNVYQLEETRTPEGFHGSFIQKNITLKEDGQTFDYTAKNFQNKGIIFINKKDEDGKDLAGAEFTQYGKDGKTIAVKKTDNDGKVSFDLLSNNTYEVKETKNPLGYHGTFDKKDITLANDGQTFEYTAKNVQDKGRIIVHKIDEAGKGLANAEFTQYGKDGKVVSVKKTDIEGNVAFDIQSNNTYEVKETKNPFGYHGMFDQKNITLANDGQTFEYSAKNIQDKGKIIIHKKDESGNPVAGAEFTETNKAGKTVALKKTNREGIVTFIIQSNDTYSVKETKVPDGYDGSFEKKNITLKNDGQVFEYIAINNHKHEELPQTGSTNYQNKGILGLVVAGITTAIGVAVYFIRKYKQA